MKAKGNVFASEFVVSCVVVFFFILVALNQASMAVKKNSETQATLEFERKAIFLVDSMIKNHDEKNPVLGAAFFDAELKRTQSNVIEAKRLANPDPKNLFVGGIRVQKIQLKFVDGKKETVFEDKAENESYCLVVERFVVSISDLERKKGLLQVTACE